METTFAVHPMSNGNGHTAERRGIPSPVLAIMILLFTEVMFFGGLISAYIINRADAIDWPPPGQPRLPVERTLLNTAFLLISGISAYWSWRFFKRNHRSYLYALVLTLVLGACFVALQGVEWIRLIHYGLTTSSSLYGAFFYTIVGVHGVHVLFGLLFLLYVWWKIEQSPTRDQEGLLLAGVLFWYFVVGIWPILYYLVYLY